MKIWSAIITVMILGLHLEAKAEVKSADRTAMKSARLHFQKNQFTAAIKDYSQIPQGSDYWLEALEEKSWAHVRLNQYGEAMSLVKTVLAPVFSPLVGSEPYYLATYIDLKTCNYTEMFKVVKLFKTNYQARALEMQTWADKGPSAKSEALVNRVLAAKTLDWQNLGADVQWLPKMYWRDSQLQKIFTQIKTAKISTSVKLADQLRAKFVRRLRVLAKRDMREIEKNLTKLQLAEAEGIERVHMKENYDDSVKTGSAIASNNQMNFPDSDEVWLDEVDHYKVKTDGCAGVQKGSSL